MPLPAIRHPILLAHQLATPDRLSQGRWVTGLGGGFPNPATRAQFAPLGTPSADRASRPAESAEVMRQLWYRRSGGSPRPATFDDVRLAPPPTCPQGPPIWLAGGGGPALRCVTRLAGGWLPYPPAVATYEAELRTIEQYEPARPATPALYATLCLDKDPELPATFGGATSRPTTAFHRDASPRTSASSPAPPARPPTASRATSGPAPGSW
ncbi:hypothetical protein GCM10010277_86590 [Streptomyces longisporoflavus]|nr:hypothetical protein GCM10010277_86590 [Streptomyces longisporoflavus]